MKNMKRGLFFLVITLLGFSIEALIDDSLFRADLVTPVELLFWSSVAAFVLFAPYFLSPSQWHTTIKTGRQHGWWAVFLGIMTSIMALLFINALQLTSADNVTLLVQIEILISGLLGYFFLREHLHWRELPGAVAAIGGLALIVSLPERMSLLAAGMAMTAATMHVTQSLLIKKYLPKAPLLTLVWLRAGVLIPITGLLLFMMGDFRLPALPILASLAVVGTVSTFIARAAFFHAARHMPLRMLSMGLLVSPILNMIGVWLLFGDVPSIQKITGACLVIGGMVFFIHEHVRQSSLPDNPAA